MVTRESLVTLLCIPKRKYPKRDFISASMYVSSARMSRFRPGTSVNPNLTRPVP